MLNDIDADDLSIDQIEEVEKISLRLAFQALIWFAPQAWDIFDRSPDDPQDIAEDVTREAIGIFKGFSINERLFGTIDFKQARWLPMTFGLVPQALMVDSKAKRAYENARLDLQMSQVSMDVLLESKEEPLQPGLKTAMDVRFEGGIVKKAITSVITAHYSYDIKPPGQDGNRLQRIIVAAVHESRETVRLRSMQLHAWCQIALMYEKMKDSSELSAPHGLRMLDYVEYHE